MEEEGLMKIVISIILFLIMGVIVFEGDEVKKKFAFVFILPIYISILLSCCTIQDSTKEKTTTSYAAKIIAVIDGDTVKICFTNKEPTGCSRTETVRLIGVDTPELHLYEETSSDKGADEAKEYTNKYFGKEVLVETDDITGMRDNYGRLLAYVWLDEGICLNREIIREGYGRYLYAFPFRQRMMESFAAAEVNAKIERRGIWQ